MKITPSAIRQKSFETAFRGYEKKEVTLFLDEISEIVDSLHKENLELKTKLQNTESEAKRLKDVEESLFRTLKTAEDTGASIIEEANEAADLIISEANRNAENATSKANQILSQAKDKAEQQAAIIIGAAETRAKETIIELRESMQGLVRSYEGLVEQRESVVKSLKRLSQDALNQIELSEAHYTRIDAKAHQRAIEELSRSQTFTFANLANLAPAETGSTSQPEEIEEEGAAEYQDQTAPPEIVKEEVPIETPVETEEPSVDVALEEAAMEDIAPEEIPEGDILEEEPKEEEIKAPLDSSKPNPNPRNQGGSFFDQFD